MEEKNRKNEEKSDYDNRESKIANGIIIGTLAILFVIFLYYGYVYLQNKKNNSNDSSTIKTGAENVKTAYQLSGNGLEVFDLAFLKLENGEKINYIVHYL